jgi:hypothetical protein
MSRAGVAIERIEARAYRVPTDAPEADGTFAWDGTTMVIAEVMAGGHRGLGSPMPAPPSRGSCMRSSPRWWSAGTRPRCRGFGRR